MIKMLFTRLLKTQELEASISVHLPKLKEMLPGNLIFKNLCQSSISFIQETLWSSLTTHCLKASFKAVIQISEEPSNSRIPSFMPTLSKTLALSHKTMPPTSCSSATEMARESQTSLPEKLLRRVPNFGPNISARALEILLMPLSLMSKLPEVKQQSPCSWVWILRPLLVLPPSFQIQPTTEKFSFHQAIICPTFSRVLLVNNL